MEIAIIALVGVCVFLLGREWNRHDERLHAMEARVRELESASKLRLPYRSQEELLDAMAAISRYMEERKIQDAFIENAAGHITNAMTVGTVREK